MSYVNLGALKFTQILGKKKFLEMKNKVEANDNLFEAIDFNAVNNSYANFEEFQKEIYKMFNLRLF